MLFCFGINHQYTKGIIVIKGILMEGDIYRIDSFGYAN